MASTRYVKGTPRRARGWDGREGNDLSDVLRDVIYELMESHRLVEEQFAERCGVSQSTINRFLNDVNDAKVGLLTNICLAFDVNPVQLVQMHPLYKAEARAGITYQKDHLFQRYNATLKNAEARGLLPLLEKAQDDRLMDQVVEAVRNVLEAADIAVRDAASRAKTGARRRRRTSR